MTQASKHNSVQDYFESQPADTLERLCALRKIILATVPEAEEVLNYQMPAYALVKGGKREEQVMMAGYKKFVGFYVGNDILPHFEKNLQGFVVGKASVQFPHNQPLPEDLIKSLILHRLKQIKERRA